MLSDHDRKLEQEIDSLQNVLNSSAFIRLIKTKQETLQREVNLCIRKHDDRKAGEELAKLDVYSNLITLVQNKINTIRSEIGSEPKKGE